MRGIYLRMTHPTPLEPGAGKRRWHALPGPDIPADFTVAPTSSYISLLRGARKLGIIQISPANHIDIGIKLKGVNPIGRFETAGTWNNMVTHRVQISDPNQIDAEVLAWLKRAYEAAQA